MQDALACELDSIPETVVSHRPGELAPWDSSSGFSLLEFYSQHKKRPRAQRPPSHPLRPRKSAQPQPHLPTPLISPGAGQPPNLHFDKIITKLRRLGCVTVRQQGLAKQAVCRRRQLTFMFVARGKENGRVRTEGARSLGARGGCVGQGM
jgi:hypothetical protein